MRGRRRAFGYLELVVAVAVAAFCLVPLVVSSTASIHGTDHASRRIVAITLTNALMERYGSLPYPTLKKRFGGGAGASTPVNLIFPSNLLDKSFTDALSRYRLVVSDFAEIEKDKVGILSFVVEYPAFNHGPPARVVISKVVPNFTELEWGKDV